MAIGSPGFEPHRSKGEAKIEESYYTLLAAMLAFVSWGFFLSISGVRL